MTIAESLTKLSTDIDAAYTAIGNKGGTVPEDKNTDNLASAVESITGGVRPPLPEYPYPIDEEEMADGGEYGKIAYLRDDTVHYYTATSATDLAIRQNSSTITSYNIKTLSDNFVITNANTLAFSAGSSITTIPDYFLVQMPLLQAVYLQGATNLKTIGSSFIYKAPNFNSLLEIPNTVTSIGNSFLQGAASYNQPLSLSSSLTTIGASFLSGCTSFNQPFILPDGLTSITHSFLYGCSSFNQPLVFPETLSTLGGTVSSYNAGVMGYCDSFNHPIQFPASLSTISPYFMYHCTNFNSTIEFRNQTATIGNGFLQECISFNQPITLPTSSTDIGANFLYACSNFNQPLQLPSTVTSIGSNFLGGCYRFTQPFTVPSAITSVGSGFMTGSYRFIGPLTLETSVHPTDNNSLSTTVSTMPMYTTGVTLTGPGAQAWKTALPDRTTSPYRKLIVAEEAEEA